MKKRLLGTNPCTYGPTYWCKDEKSAAECNVGIVLNLPRIAVAAP